MFADFLTRLVRPDPAPLTELDAQLALTALLVRVAQSDGVYAASEREVIRQIAQTRYGLDAAATTDLLTRAEQLEAEAPDTVRFTRAIKDSVAYEDRLGVIEALWSVVLADGSRDPEEDALLRLASSLLGITDQDSNAARLRVARG
ncbi:TerB family tellurite resistance protein [Pseudooceanicola sp. MF1-13]|uniref:tellurite resistance TerB family protein n=1 Tax=Pseudooceanicola sp. MF1-13 TaxID=3379095 RepID=UPI003891E0D7